MRYVTFPSKNDADAFVASLAQEQAGMLSNRHLRFTPGTTVTPGGQTLITDKDGNRYVATDGGTADDAGQGAIKGTGVGAVVGAVAGTIATVATGGLALPLVLGMAVLGSGVGASVGAVGGALGVDETPGDTLLGTKEVIDLNDEDRDLIYVRGGEGRAIAVDDSVPLDVVERLSGQHGGTITHARA